MPRTCLSKRIQKLLDFHKKYVESGSDFTEIQNRLPNTEFKCLLSFQQQKRDTKSIIIITPEQLRLLKKLKDEIGSLQSHHGKIQTHFENGIVDGFTEEFLVLGMVCILETL